jgi:hypothetical protein
VGFRVALTDFSVWEGEFAPWRHPQMDRFWLVTSLSPKGPPPRLPRLYMPWALRFPFVVFAA